MIFSEDSEALFSFKRGDSIELDNHIDDFKSILTLDL